VLGELRDLSQDGCQLELPLAASGVLAETDAPLKIALTFPNGTYFEVHAVARHQKTDPERHLLRVGFRFTGCTSEQERQIWYFVCEIEREASRYKKEAQEERQPSPLFEQPSRRAPDTEHVGRRDIRRYATPMARRLVKVAAFLDRLRHGKMHSDAFDGPQRLDGPGKLTFQSTLEVDLLSKLANTERLRFHEL
jgi:hypothetical protein